MHSLKYELSDFVSPDILDDLRLTDISPLLPLLIAYLDNGSNNQNLHMDLMESVDDYKRISGRSLDVNLFYDLYEALFENHQFKSILRMQMDASIGDDDFKVSIEGGDMFIFSESNYGDSY